MSNTHALRQIDLLPLRRRNNHMRASIQSQQLREHQTRRPRAQQQHTGALLRADLVEAVRGARGRLHQRRIHIGEVLDRKHFARGIGAVLGESAGERHAVGLEVLAKQQLAAAAVEAFAAEFLGGWVSGMHFQEKEGGIGV